MSFGYSVTDLVAGANLTYQLIHTMSKSRGASIEYQEALSELRAMEQAFIQAGYLAKSNIFDQDVINAIACISLSSIDTIEKFHERTKGIQSGLGSQGNSLHSSWAKIGWQVYKKEELRTLKTQLSERLSSINTLVTTASNCIKVSSTVAKYQDKTIEDAANRYSMRQSTRSPYPPEPFHHRIPTFPEVPPIHPDGTPPNATPKERDFNRHAPKIETSPAKLEREIRAKIGIENGEAAVESEVAVAEAQFKNKIDSIMQMMTFLHEREAKKEAEAKAEAEKAKKVVRFKDAVGRKFSFPFHICNTWEGMEDLIKQAFLHVDVIGPHVQAGHYDLIGPNGEIILPQVWQKVVQPDWQVTMHMWPMDRAKLPPQPPPEQIQQRPPGSGSQDAQQSLRKASKYELLDIFDPNWREAYKGTISTWGLTDEFIRTHQPEIITLFQTERNKVVSQIRKNDSLASWSLKRSLFSGDGDISERRPRLRERKLSRSGTNLRRRRRIIFKNRHQKESWQTDEEEEKL